MQDSAATETPSPPSPPNSQSNPNWDQPLGLPAGSVRAILAILTSLTVAILIVLKYVQTGDLDENLLALLGVAAGTYAGTRAVGSAVANSQSSAVKAVKLATELVGPQLDAQTARIQDEAARAISSLQSELRETRRRLAISERLVENYQDERLEAQLAQERERIEAERRETERLHGLEEPVVSDPLRLT